MCNVTNEKILQVLGGKIPQATFECNKTAAECSFQFWIQEDESFFCDLSKCDYEYDLAANSTHYKCEEVACECLPDKMLCGKSGSIDISDFLTETIKGPGDFSCDVHSRACKFSEPSMNDLIMNVFGDPYITLSCLSGECLHASEIPGFAIPPKDKFTLSDLLRVFSVIFACAAIVGISIYGAKQSPLFASGPVALPSDDNDGGDDYLMADYVPATFAFDKVSYSINEKPILSNSFGLVKPGEILAIMGSSGAGKTTLLDILAGKNKGGKKSGYFFVNGERIVSGDDLKHFQRACGFVDQEDYLIPTLTVYETVLNSALLRLPRSMSTEAKTAKVMQILSELRILHIKDKLIGSDFERGISGGEKRRVAIACELVTSPSILFLDEPTTGLDGFNAFRVVESLVRLAKDFNRTIIFSIHQPRSNIVALFDKLLLLSDGEVVYSGLMDQCSQFFADRGYQCPSGYNIADYLIDITSGDSSLIQATRTTEAAEDPRLDPLLESGESHRPPQGTGDDMTSEWAHYASHRDELRVLVPSGTKESNSSSPLATLFSKSTEAEQLHEDIKSLASVHRSEQASEDDPSFFKDDPNRARAGFFTQLSILCSRTFKNSYRNPRLLMGHYLLAILMGFFCSYLYYDVQNNISGFQNRLGLFFFILTMFGFSTLTGLHSFSIERIVFIRERSNNYYNPLSYYLSKIICDVIPLRLFPPIIFMAIIYPLVGLNMAGHKFWFSLAIIILFNMATAVEILIIGILVKEPGSATMLGVLVMLFSLLFAGLFINKDTIPGAISWFERISVFHYGYEALSVNEVNGLVLKEKKYGLDIKVPGAVILSTFGFDVNAVLFDIYWLLGMLGAFTILGYLGLYYFVYETR
ncbi:DEKNAAC102250 [Brettanomyces naardenensis]|uniref:DEKNAAC102250 n=1 Tax=Brettanomyces naardenensis TaxID=13370 RepID=A0A448YL29_BRENA|nr:DEKNAAC102250 [Brettanomyces naardenensis]